MTLEELRSLIAAMIVCDGGTGSQYYHAGEYFDARAAVLDALISAPAVKPDTAKTEERR